jgi:hypothetical protein
MHLHVVTGQQQVIRPVASGFLRIVAGGLAGALNWDLSIGSRRRPRYYTWGVPMQQWLNLVPMIGALVNLSAAITNLAITIINRRGTTSDPADNDVAR